jgi:predicted histidine transporter YuiF (NhaC family)
MEVSLPSIIHLLLVSHLESQYGKQHENLREKCIGLLLQLDIVTATVIQVHMSRLRIVLPWLGPLRTRLALHRQLLLRPLLTTGFKQ